MITDTSDGSRRELRCAIVCLEAPRCKPDASRLAPRGLLRSLLRIQYAPADVPTPQTNTTGTWSLSCWILSGATSPRQYINTAEHSTSPHKSPTGNTHHTPAPSLDISCSLDYACQHKVRHCTQFSRTLEKILRVMCFSMQTHAEVTDDSNIRCLRTAIHFAATTAASSPTCFTTRASMPLKQASLHSPGVIESSVRGTTDVCIVKLLQLEVNKAMGH